MEGESLPLVHSMIGPVGVNGIVLVEEGGWMSGRAGMILLVPVEDEVEVETLLKGLLEVEVLVVARELLLLEIWVIVR